MAIGASSSSDGRLLALHNDSDVTSISVPQGHKVSETSTVIRPRTAFDPKNDVASAASDLHSGCLSVLNPDDWEKVSSTRFFHVVRTESGDLLLLDTLPDPSALGVKLICEKNGHAWYAYHPSTGPFESEDLGVTVFPIDPSLRSFVERLSAMKEANPNLQAEMWWWDIFDRIVRQSFPSDMFDVPQHLWDNVSLEIPSLGAFPSLVIHTFVT